MAADLGSILNDLTRSVRRCELIRSGDYPSDVNEALWEAAIVAYGRSFTLGRDALGRAGQRRQITDRELSVLSPSELEVHRSVRVERNRHVGHRDDPVGEAALVLRAEGEAEAAGIKAIGLSLSRRVVTLERVVQLQAVAEKLHATLLEAYDREVEALIDAV